jgi:hypothetical protein
MVNKVLFYRLEFFAPWLNPVDMFLVNFKYLIFFGKALLINEQTRICGFRIERFPSFNTKKIGKGFWVRILTISLDINVEIVKSL